MGVADTALHSSGEPIPPSAEPAIDESDVSEVQVLRLAGVSGAQVEVMGQQGPARQPRSVDPGDPGARPSAVSGVNHG